MGPKRQAAASSKSRKRTKTATNGGRNFDDPDLSDHETSAGPSRPRNQMMIEDEDDDVQAGYEDADGHYVGEIFIPPKFVRVEPPQTGERLVIEKIVCENFKSYGGVKEMGPFHKNFSAIVGPNGNGKSNIIDAMLFVFGYRAAKIRCKKVSVLIHKSELLPSLSSCAVTVHFVKIIDDGKNDDSHNVVPNSKITVMRRAYLDNSSGYWLDGRKVNFQTVASFLKVNGIDIVHNRFLILQGEVESIAQMPPKTPNGLETGLLEFLEEVIGTKRYLKPLCELERKVEQLDYEREEKLQRVDIVEKEKQAMHEPVKKAKDFLRDQNTRSRYQHQICQVKNLHYVKKAQDLESKIVPFQQDIQKVNDRLGEIKSTNDTRKKEFEQEEKAFNSIKNEHDKKKKALEANEAEYVKHFESIKRANDQRKKLLKEKVKKEEEILKLNEIPRTHEVEKVKLQRRLEELNKLIADEEQVVEREMKKLNDKITNVLKEKTETDKVKNKWLPVRHEKSMKVQQINRELEKYKATEAEAKDVLEKYHKQLQELQDSIAEREGQANMSSLESKLAELKQQLKVMEEELSQVRQKENEKRLQMVNLSSELQEAKDSLEGSGTNDQIYKLFFGEKEQGRLKGLYGRLKDLATIDEKYNVAVTVSTGMLDYWVVDNDDTGTQCINLLKQRGMQFQNFVCLNRIKDLESAMKRRFDAPHNSQRLFDLLKVSNPDVNVAFYKALRDTLVCDNIDIASHIGYGKADGKRYRVTSLVGDLIEPSGSMTGGGRARIVGKMNSGMAARLTSTVSKKDVEKLQRQFESLNKELTDLSARKTQLETDIFNLKPKIKETTAGIQNFHSDLQALKNKLPLVQNRYSEQQTKVREAAISPKVLKEKEAALKAAEKEAEEVEESSKEAMDAATAVDERLNDMKGRQKEEIRKKLEKYKHQHKTVEDEMDKLTVDLRNYDKNKNKAEAKIKGIEKDVEKLENDMRTWKQMREDIEVASKGIKVELEKLSSELEAAREALANKKDVLNEFKDEEKKLAKKKVELDAKIEEVSNNLKGLQRHIHHNQQAMENLVLKPIPEEEVPPLAILTSEELENLSMKELEAKLAKYEKKLQGESPNLNILEEYNRKVEQFLQRVGELDKVTAERDMYRDAFISTTAQRLAEFMEGFAIISSKLKEMFRMISMGGDAELDLVDSTDPFSSGVQFSVRPARKTWKKISNLSGGEKTLSSLALIFALHYFKPSPFYVMDEIDAALDFKNVSIIANYIKDRTKFTQFIIISLRSNMFELADSLLGVYKVDNMSYSIHIGVSKMLSGMKVKPQGELPKNGEGSSDHIEGTQQPNSEEATSSQKYSGSAIPSSQSSVATQRITSQELTTQPSSGSAQPATSSGSNNFLSTNQAFTSGLLLPTQVVPASQTPPEFMGSPIASEKTGGRQIPMEVASPMAAPPVPRGGVQSGSSNDSIGRPLSTSTPLRNIPPTRRAGEPVDALDGIEEENSGAMDEDEDDDDDENAAEISQILAGDSNHESAAKFGNEDFEFPHSSTTSDDESELSATLSE